MHYLNYFVAMEGKEYTCSMCYHFAAPNMTAVLRHIGTVHSHQPSFRIVCGINGCPRTYTIYHSFRKHLRRKHFETLGEGLSENLSCCDQGDDISSSGSHELSESSPVWDKRSATLFVLKNKEVRQISQFALNDLLCDVSMVMKQSVESLSSRISSVLERNGINICDVDGLDEVLSNEELSNPFLGLDSAYLQRKAYCSLGLVVSIS